MREKNRQFSCCAWSHGSSFTIYDLLGSSCSDCLEAYQINGWRHPSWSTNQNLHTKSSDTLDDSMNQSHRQQEFWKSRKLTKSMVDTIHLDPQNQNLHNKYSETSDDSMNQSNRQQKVWKSPNKGCGCQHIQIFMNTNPMTGILRRPASIIDLVAYKGISQKECSPQHLLLLANIYT